MVLRLGNPQVFYALSYTDIHGDTIERKFENYAMASLLYHALSECGVEPTEIETVER
jgi:hypothetical protein